MPSYRVRLTIGVLAPGVEPASVLPAARDAVAELAAVEATSIVLERDGPGVVVRFTADDDELAAQVADHAAASTASLATLGAVALTRRDGARWVVTVGPVRGTAVGSEAGPDPGSRAGSEAAPASGSEDS